MRLSRALRGDISEGGEARSSREGEGERAAAGTRRVCERAGGMRKPTRASNKSAGTLPSRARGREPFRNPPLSVAAAAALSRGRPHPPADAAGYKLPRSLLSPPLLPRAVVFKSP